ncbi:enoyl-CoA hydratase-related protein [Microbacterium sp. ARD31]|uniref:enoyl-CoA hydratase/isomerase family protein n=1 Tax=Microbacterium sp. ARD31 TaxID=2962576 RepID=UPI00288259AB|nr:enoyl-CoA hydratase-related protein [Microbacterium sp. ARD31]MDT0183108.1 enoyl-CoA hydratase-related protein [Microbacterium sp. ARD31]
MIVWTIADGVAEVVLDAPHKRNAVDLGDIAELDAAYLAAERAGARALVLRGEGHAFCAGRDIADVDPATDDVHGYLAAVERLMRRMSEFPVPTFAAVHGACLGVGLGLAIAADVVYVADDAKVGSPFVNLGATLDSGGHALFYERLGAHRALDLIFTGDLLTGSEAVAAGLFSRAMPADELVEFTRERAARAASGPTLAFAASKRIIADLRGERLWRAVDAETAAQADLAATADYRDGFAAFRAKRAPDFRGA